MLIAEARNRVAAHLGSSKRAEHSIFVAYIMRRLAERLGTDDTMWEAVGLCHDLDFFDTAGDRRQHGILAATWLESDLPPEALNAIRAHDHRTGIEANTAIADALKLADAVAIADETAGRETLVAVLEAEDIDELRAVLASRPYVPGMIVTYSLRLAVPISAIAPICRNAPAQ
jgi:putative nucleotidyltransferase with HDIG domain